MTRTVPRSLRPILLLPFLSLPAAPLAAQFTPFGTRDGLPGASVSVIANHGGKVLLGTSGGLAEFDGVHWRTWDAAAGLPGRGVFDIHPARDGSILLAGDGGIARWDGADGFVEEAPFPPDPIVGLKVLEIDEATDGAIWMRGNFGVARNDGSGWSLVDPEGGGDNPYRSLLCASDGSVWVGTTQARGLFRYQDGAWTRFDASSGFAAWWAYRIMEDSSGNIWVANDLGASRYDGSTWTLLDADDGLNLFCTFVFEDSRGNFWFGVNEDEGGGVKRWDGEVWTHFTTADGLVSRWVSRVGEDAQGGIWIGTDDRGVSRYDGTSWQVITEADGMQPDVTHCVFEDAAGDIWIGGTGTSRWDGTKWNPLPILSPPDEYVFDIAQDASGAMWFATMQGLVVRRNGNWTGPLGTADGFPGDFMPALLVDSLDRVWVATQSGLSMHQDGTWVHWDSASLPLTPAVGEYEMNSFWELAEDGEGGIWAAGELDLLRWTEAGGWSTVPVPPREDWLSPQYRIAISSAGVPWVTSGLRLYRYPVPGGPYEDLGVQVGSQTPQTLEFDEAGSLWIGGDTGLYRYRDGVLGHYAILESGLTSGYISDLLEDSHGVLWMAGEVVTRHEQDRVPPVSVLLSGPPAASSSRRQTVNWAAGFKEVEDIVFQTSLDGGAWSVPQALPIWTAEALADGDHELRIRARDRIGNQEPDPLRVTFTIDATPPVPSLTEPGFEAPVSGVVAIRGTASDPRFLEYVVEARAEGGESWIELGSGVDPVEDDVLATWDTRSAAEGMYELRVRVEDDVDLVGTAVSRVIVDNEAPFAAVTSPVRITPAGGEVYSTRGEARLFFPERAFVEETIVRLELAGAGSVPATLPDGAQLAWSGVVADWGNVEPGKAATLDLHLPGTPEATPVVYALRPGGVWEYLGGTWDPQAGSLGLPVTRPGLHAVFTGGQGATLVPAGLGGITLTPRVLRPGGERMTIAFSLERSGSVSISVYNRAGRLVRILERDLEMASGIQAVRWDGRDDEGSLVGDGLYLVSVEALGSRQTRTLAVAR